MIQLYGFQGAASLAPHILLEELGLPYELIMLNPLKLEHKTEKYMRLNPNGRVPTLIDGEQAIYESAAICLHLCDKLDNTDLLPRVGDPLRGQVYKWMMFLTNTLQPALIGYFYPDRYSTVRAHAADIKAKAEMTAMQLYQQIDSELAIQGPYLLGQHYTIADIYLMMLVRWGRYFSNPPATHFPHLHHLVGLLSERPAIQRAFAQENIPAPYCLIPAA